MCPATICEVAWACFPPMCSWSSLACYIDRKAVSRAIAAGLQHECMDRGSMRVSGCSRLTRRVPCSCAANATCCICRQSCHSLQLRESIAVGPTHARQHSHIARTHLRRTRMRRGSALPWGNCILSTLRLFYSELLRVRAGRFDAALDVAATLTMAAVAEVAAARRALLLPAPLHCEMVVTEAAMVAAAAARLG